MTRILHSRLQGSKTRPRIALIAIASTAMTLASFVGAVVTSQPAQAQTYAVLYEFSGGTDGRYPTTGLIVGKTGDLFGTTSQGGISGGCGGGGCGTVFKLNQFGKLTVLHRFRNGSDGASPYGDLILDGMQALYGTTANGGTHSNGTVFKLEPSGKLTPLHSFSGGLDGGSPNASLLLDAAGNLYGTTAGGGRYGWGTVFKLDKTNKLTVLYSFSGMADGGRSYSALVRDSKGNLYGTAALGGDMSCDPPYGCGVVFKLSANRKETVLHKFTGADGATPEAGLIRDGSGNFYGTAWQGGNAGCNGVGCGAVFELGTSGKETTLFGFTGGPDGGAPLCSLFRDGAGNLFGTTTLGGTAGLGTVFEVNKSTGETVLHTFQGQPTDGAVPYDRLIRDAKGNFYGTTYYGGTSNYGYCTRSRLDRLCISAVVIFRQERLPYEMIPSVPDYCFFRSDPAAIPAPSFKVWIVSNDSSTKFPASHWASGL